MTQPVGATYVGTSTGKILHKMAGRFQKQDPQIMAYDACLFADAINSHVDGHGGKHDVL